MSTHPPPWRWLQDDGALVDANGALIAWVLDTAEFGFASPAVRETVRAAPEMAALLRWFVDMAATSPVHPRVAAARALLDGIDTAKAGT